MPSNVLRIAPSGRPVNEDPAFTGLQIRLAESVTSVALLAITATAAPIVEARSPQPVWSVGLDNPSRDYQYKVEAQFFVESLTGTAAQCEFNIEASYDGGATWNVLWGSVLVTGQSGNPEATLVQCNLGATEATALLVPLPATATSLDVRVTGRSAAASEYTVPAWGTNWGNAGRLSLYELA